MLADHDVHDFAEALRRWRKRRGMTQRALAERMAYHPSRVSQIEGGAFPHEEFVRQADSVLGAKGDLWRSYEALAATHGVATAPAPERELGTTDFIAWLADHTDVDFGTLYGAVNDAVFRLEAERPSVRYDRDRRRRNVSRPQLADAMVRHYGADHFYRARVSGIRVSTAVATRPEWLDSPKDLRGPQEQFRYVPPGEPPLPGLSTSAVTAAVSRLADVEVNGTVLVNNPLYRLLDFELSADRLAATVTTVEFAHHALTTELMEGEALDAITIGSSPLPLREAFLPTIQSALDVAGRVCVGGAASVLAIARGRRHGERDYVILTQERSRTVVNTTGKLAVIPKAFHQPTGEAADEAAISATLRREFEEELLGRHDLEQVRHVEHAHVDLLHSQHLTEPMTWLLDRGPDIYRVECTGVGFNTVTGNYEFACLIVIDDESWWDQYGHLVEVNWEAERVHRHSSLDGPGLEALIADPRWGNESLFTFLQGLRRLAQVGEPQRLAIPTIDLEA